MNVLVIGGGGREHALAWKLAQSPKVSEVFCAPGNAGTSSIATNVDIAVDNLGALALWATEQNIALTVVGPEAPLAAGLVDVFSEHGLKVFGPTQAAAQLEASKTFAKDVMLKSGVRTAAGETFTDADAAKTYIKDQGAPIVVKADGLAAGKGVVVAMSESEALQAVDDLLVSRSMGDAGASIVVEQFLDGREASLMAIVDGETVLPLVVSQDYKRVGEGDSGLNTGGMGAISPTSVLPDDQVEQMSSEVFLPVIRELRSRGIRYNGFLYAGLMVERDGTARVLEFNCRLGDPETQILMMRLQSDLFSALYAAVNGNLDTVELMWNRGAAACVVAASAGYPQAVDDNKRISGLEDVSHNSVVFHAGTRADDDGSILTKGGRVFAVSSTGADVTSALEQVYKDMERVSFEGMHFRTDIGKNNIS